MSLVTLTHEVAAPPWEIIRGAGNITTLDWRFEVDGVATAASSATATLKSGSTTIHAYTVAGGDLTIAASGIQAALDGSDFADYAMFDALWLSLEAQVNGRLERYGSQVIVTDQIVRCPCRMQEVLRLRREFTDVANYVDGHTVDDEQPGWVWKLEECWLDLRQEVWNEFPQMDWARVRTPASFRQWMRHWTAAEIADVIAGDRGRTSDLLDFRDDHREQASWWREKARVLLRDLSTTEAPDEPVVTNLDVERPYWIMDANPEGFI